MTTGGRGCWCEPRGGILGVGLRDDNLICSVVRQCIWVSSLMDAPSGGVTLAKA